MARVFITGSSQGLGLMAGRLLAEQGHSVVLHARDVARAKVARAALPGVAAVLAADASEISQLRHLADQVNAIGRFDAVIHNMGIGYQEPRRVETKDGFSKLWAVNVLAPYVLTALIERPERLVYLSSGMHLGGDPSLEDLQWIKAPLERQPGLFRHQAPRRAARLRRGTPLAKRLVECRHARLGRNEDGRPRGDRRPLSGAPDPGVARGERQAGRAGIRAVPLPHEARR